MSNDREPAGTSDTGKFYGVQAHRDLESNWAVDLAKNLQDYLLKICSGEFHGTADDDSHLSINFAEAALLLQGSIQVYSRKVEYLYSLVLHALEFISQKSQQDQPQSTSAQPEESGSHAVPAEADDSFWGLDDIPVDPKNSLDNTNCRDTPLNYFVKPPANLVVLEGDCLDASGDSGELESYLLATNDLYRDFILLDSCDAVAVNDYLDSQDKATKGKSVRGSSFAAKSRKSFFSPSKRSGGTGLKLSTGKSQDANLNRSSLVDRVVDFNDCAQPPVSNVSENNMHDLEMDDGFSEPWDFDEEGEEEEEDPWKPLNPHEKGTLKVKPFKRVKAYRRVCAKSSKRIPITKEFPLARLHGTISSEFNEMWETQRHLTERNQEPSSPPLYEKLRQSLVLGGEGDFNAFTTDKDDQDNGYDSAGPDFDPPDFDMSENAYMNEEPFHPEKHDDGATHFDTNEAYGHYDPNSHASLEDLCRSHLDSLLASIAETEKQTALAARVSTWKQRIELNLEEQDSRPPFDIHEYGQRVLDKLALESDAGISMPFTDVVRGQEKHDVARTFSALLQLVNNGNIELEKSRAGDELTCYTAVNPFHLRLLSHDKRRDVQLRSSKKRAKSPLTKGKENRPSATSSPLASTSTALSSQTNSKFSVKLGKVGGFRCTPEGKKRRRSRLVEPVGPNSARLTRNQHRLFGS